MKSAFTLIEFLVVIAIIVIISTIILMTLGGTENKAGIANGLNFSQTLLHGLGYNCQGMWDFETGSGDTVKDKSGYGNNGTWSGAGIHWQENDINELGVAAVFNGSSDYVALNGLFYNQEGQIEEVTVEFWLKTTDTRAAIVDFDVSEYYGVGINFQGNQTDGAISWETRDEQNSGHNMSSDTLIHDDAWHHVAVVFDSESGNKAIYIDGQEDILEEEAHHAGRKLGTGDTRYGFLGDGSEATSFDGTRNLRYYEGLLDDVRIYHQALENVEIYKHYTEGLKKLVKE